MIRKERQLLYPRIRKNIPGKWVPIENPLVAGTPDLLYNLNGNVGFLEMKYRTSRPRLKSSLNVTDVQALFSTQWIEENGRCWLIVYVEKSKETILVNGVHLLYKGNARIATWEEWTFLASYHGTIFTDWIKIKELLCL